MSTPTATRSNDVTKKRGAPKKPTGVGRHVRLRPAIVTMAETLSRAKGMAMSDYLSDLLEAPISREYAKVMRELERKGGGE